MFIFLSTYFALHVVYFEHPVGVTTSDKRL